MKRKILALAEWHDVKRMIYQEIGIERDTMWVTRIDWTPKGAWLIEFDTEDFAYDFMKMQIWGVCRVGNKAVVIGVY